MVPRQSVLIINGRSDTEEVLRAVLEPRGWDIGRLDCPGAGTAGAGGGLPSLVIAPGDASPAEDREADIDWTQIPRVVIGPVDPLPPCGDSRCLPQPFQYGELIEAIETLMG